MINLTGMFYTEEMGVVDLWYPDGDHCATIENNLALGIEAHELAKFICKATKSFGTGDDKMFCQDCDWHGTDYLIAKSPFDSESLITACPKCKGVNTLSLACDEPECWKEATCGTPTETRYRRTCGKHVPHSEPDRINP